MYGYLLNLNIFMFVFHGKRGRPAPESEARLVHHPRQPEAPAECPTKIESLVNMPIFMAKGSHLFRSGVFGSGSRGSQTL